MLEKRDWVVTHQKDEGHMLLVQEKPFRARFWDFWYTLYDNFDHHVTRHWLCGSSVPEWFYKVPTGKPHRDDDGWLENSVGAALYNTNSKITFALMNRMDKHTRDLARVEVDDETFKKLWPDAAWLLNDDEDDED